MPIDNQNNIKFIDQPCYDENYISTNNCITSFDEISKHNEQIQSQCNTEVQLEQIYQNIEHQDEQTLIYQNNRMNQEFPIQNGSSTNFRQQQDSQTHLQSINKQNQLSQSQICSSNTFGHELENFCQQQQQMQQQFNFSPQNRILWIENSQMNKES
ncbi:hypothetical protein ABPG72_001907 [Tetrahymena utriculariae]